MPHHWIMTIEYAQANGISRHTRNGTCEVTGTRQQVFEQLLSFVKGEVGGDGSATCVLFYALEPQQ